MPVLLDLFCGAGGASAGYAAAGFDVVGVDNRPQPHYPFTFIQADALRYVTDHGHGYDVIHASPPCQGYSSMTADHDRHPRMINSVRRALRRTGRPYVIENVVGAHRDMINPVKLCGSAFNLPVRRHRLFESDLFIMTAGCFHDHQGTPIGVYGDHPERIVHRRPWGNGTQRGRKAYDIDEASAAMGIDWMTWREITQAIPPAYTEHVGTQIMAALEHSPGQTTACRREPCRTGR